MGFALISLMAYLLVPTLLIYWAGISFLGGKNLTSASKAVGFGIALLCAAVAALIFAPVSSVASAETMFWQGSAAGAIVGVGAILAIGKRKSDNVPPTNNA